MKLLRGHNIAAFLVAMVVVSLLGGCGGSGGGDPEAEPSLSNQLIGSWKLVEDNEPAYDITWTFSDGGRVFVAYIDQQGTINDCFGADYSVEGSVIKFVTCTDKDWPGVVDLFSLTASVEGDRLHAVIDDEYGRDETDLIRTEVKWNGEEGEGCTCNPFAAWANEKSLRFHKPDELKAVNEIATYFFNKP